MVRENSSQGILTVDLPREPEMGAELKAATEITRDRGDCDVVVDFSNVDIVSSSSISKLLRLNKLLTGCEHRLVLCGLANDTRDIFAVAGLDEVFEFTHDKSAALAAIKNAQQEKSEVRGRL